MSAEDREMCHRMQDNGEFWCVCFPEAHNNTQNTESGSFHLIRGGLKLNTNSLLNRMTLEDFCTFYSDLDICCLCPDFLDGSASCHWKTYCYEGRWVAGISAGGCLNNIGTLPGLATPCSLPLLKKRKRKIFAAHMHFCPRRELLD